MEERVLVSSYPDTESEEDAVQDGELISSDFLFVLLTMNVLTDRPVDPEIYNPPAPFMSGYMGIKVS